MEHNLNGITRYSNPDPEEEMFEDQAKNNCFRI